MCFGDRFSCVRAPNLFVRVRLRFALSNCYRFFDLLPGGLFPALNLSFVSPFMLAQIRFRNLQAIPADGSLKQSFVHVEGIVMLCVAGKAKTMAHHHLRAMS